MTGSKAVIPELTLRGLSGRCHQPDPGRAVSTPGRPRWLSHAHTAMITAQGIPLSLYRDRHNIFQRNDAHWTLAEELSGKQTPTHFGRALEELGIEQIPAYSPQAKGRIERAWRTCQDRLVSELRLAQAATLLQANAVLQRFCARLQSGRASAFDPATDFRPLPRRFDLARCAMKLTSAGCGVPTTWSLDDTFRSAIIAWPSRLRSRNGRVVSSTGWHATRLSRRPAAAHRSAATKRTHRPSPVMASAAEKHLHICKLLRLLAPATVPNRGVTKSRCS